MIIATTTAILLRQRQFSIDDNRFKPIVLTSFRYFDILFLFSKRKKIQNPKLISETSVLDVLFCEQVFSSYFEFCQNRMCQTVQCLYAHILTYACMWDAVPIGSSIDFKTQVQSIVKMRFFHAKNFAASTWARCIRCTGKVCAAEFFANRQQHRPGP